MDFTKDSFRKYGFYRGQVLSNSDPQKLGRIKVRIYSVYKDIDTDYLEWAVPAQSLLSGSGSGYGHFAVPEVNSWVWCFFEMGDIYQPVYFAEAPSGVHGIPTESQTNYPQRKVVKTKNGVVIYIDDSNQKISISTPAGSSVVLDESGGITINASGNITISGAQIDLNP